MEKPTKTEVVRALVRDGKIREAMSIIRTFRIGFNKDERRSIQIASDVLNGYGGLYEQIGINTSSEVNKAIQMVLKRYK